MSNASSPLVEKVKRHPGIAGQFSVSALVTYPGESAQAISFVGSSFGGPVAMVTDMWGQQPVSDPARFGSFSADPVSWVHAFCA